MYVNRYFSCQGFTDKRGNNKEMMSQRVPKKLDLALKNVSES